MSGLVSILSFAKPDADPFSQSNFTQLGVTPPISEEPPKPADLLSSEGELHVVLVTGTVFADLL
jgi:hypothetical protein